MHSDPDPPRPDPVRGTIPWQVLALSLLLTCIATYYLLATAKLSSDYQQAWGVLALGLVTSAILFGLARSQVRARLEAEEVAARLTRSEEALRETSERYRQLVELCPEAIFVQREGRFAFVNSALVRLLDAAGPDEILGRPVLDFIHPDWRERAAERGSLRLPSPVPETAAMQPAGLFLEEQWISRAGRTIDVEAAASTFLDRGTTVTQVLLRDISGHKRLYEAERDARAEAETANQVKDRFMAALSHELRTPLTPVLAVVATLEKELSQLVSHRLGTIRRNVELEARLIDDLLDLTRINRGKLELKPDVTDLREVLEHALDACWSGRERFEIALAEGDDLRLLADGPRLTQVFWNLMTNALKFSPDGGAIQIRAHRDPAAGEIVAEVSDRGIGIDPLRLPRVFEAFEQGQRSITRDYGGLGLGLAISKTIVELHGGRIEAESDGPGQGATFRLHLPVGAAHLPALRPEQTPARLAAAAPSTEGEDRPLHILLVEDHPDTADAMESLLSVVGHRITVANNARQALAAAESTQEGIDLVISDVGLPDQSGLELMTELKRRFQLRGIALSGYGMDEDLRRSREAGFERHLTKPVNLEMLRTAIRDVAGREPPPVPGTSIEPPPRRGGHMDLQVEHNETDHKYSAWIDGNEAEVTYREEGDSLVFTHTLVAEALRGRKVGEELVRQAVADARRRGRHVSATCPFVERYLERHPEDARRTS
jgi:two-component system CheB/CheR fusion protein